VELSDWSFDKCQDVASPKWFKCRIVGVLKGHSHKATKKLFHSAEIKFIGSGREVVDCNLIRYKLIGPSNPVMHRAPRELQSIMAPFSKGDWPVDYSERLKNIGLFFCPNPAGSTLPKAAGPSLSEMMLMVAQENREQVIVKLRGIVPAVPAESARGSPPSSSTRDGRAEKRSAESASSPPATPGSAHSPPIVAGVAGRSDDVNASVRCSLLGPSLLFRKFVFSFCKQLLPEEKQEVVSPSQSTRRSASSPPATPRPAPPPPPPDGAPPAHASTESARDSSPTPSARDERVANRRRTDDQEEGEFE